MIKTLPVPLGTIQNSGFMFSSEEAYHILRVGSYVGLKDQIDNFVYTTYTFPFWITLQ